METLRKNIGEQSKAYFAEMNVSPSFYELMVSIPPHRLRRLTLDEAEKFGVTVTDPSYHDYRMGMKAQSLGITKQELLRRMAAGEATCDPPAQAAEEHIEEMRQSFIETNASHCPSDDRAFRCVSEAHIQADAKVDRLKNVSPTPAFDA